MRDIVSELRRMVTFTTDYAPRTKSLAASAADEIERLRGIINRAGALAMQGASSEHIRETLAALEEPKP